MKSKLETKISQKFSKEDLSEFSETIRVLDYLYSTKLITPPLSAQPPVDPYSRLFQKKKSYPINYLG